MARLHVPHIGYLSWFDKRRIENAHMTLDISTPEGRKQAYKDLTWGDHGFLRVWFNNQHLIGGEDVRDKMYRANQPSPKRIAQLAKDGIKTIVNLRGGVEERELGMHGEETRVFHFGSYRGSGKCACFIV